MQSLLKGDAITYYVHQTETMCYEFETANMLGKPFKAFTDHRALKFIQSQSSLNMRHEKLQEFDVNIEYLPGHWNKLADVLSRLPAFEPKCTQCKAQISNADIQCVSHNCAGENINFAEIMEIYESVYEFKTILKDYYRSKQENEQQFYENGVIKKHFTLHNGLY